MKEQRYEAPPPPSPSPSPSPSPPPSDSRLRGEYVRELIRASVILVLSAWFVYYVSAAASKYARGDVGMTIEESPGRLFRWPVVVVCSEVFDFAGADSYPPWINLVHQHSYVMPEEKGQEDLLSKRPSRILTLMNEVHRGVNVSGMRAGDIWRSFVVADSQTSEDDEFYCNAYRSSDFLRTRFGIKNHLDLNLESAHLDPDAPFFAVAVLDGDTFRPFDIFDSVVLIPKLTEAERDKQEASHLRKNYLLAIKAEEYRSLGRPGRVCLSEGDFARQLAEKGTVFDCTYNYLASRLSCGGVVGEKGRRGKPPCSGEGHEREFEELTRRLVNRGEQEFYDEIGCQLPCSRMRYSVRQESLFESAAEDNTSAASVTVTLFNPSTARTEVKREYLIYDFAALTGAVGGMLGMLLGASILSLHDTVVALLDTAFKRLTRPLTSYND